MVSKMFIMYLTRSLCQTRYSRLLHTAASSVGDGSMLAATMGGEGAPPESEVTAAAAMGDGGGMGGGGMGGGGMGGGGMGGGGMSLELG